VTKPPSAANGRPTGPQRLTGPAAISAVAALVGTMFMGSTLLTPLYAIYGQAFGFSEIVLTLIYAVYVVGNLGALLFFGRLSDQVGRRPTALLSVAIAGISTLLFLFATGTAWLFWARMLSGFAIGLASGTGTAWITELDDGGDKARATLVTTSANFLGLAIGSLLSGTLAEYAPWPLHLPFAVYLVTLAVIGILIARTRETVARPVRSLGGITLRPRLGVPRDIRARFIAPAVTAFGTFALFGFYAALAPTVLIESLHQTNRAIGGAVVFELAAIAAATVVMTRTMASRRAMLSGLVLLLPSLALLVIAQALGSLTALLIGTAISGLSGALGYRGSLQVVSQIAPDAQRAEVVSSYFVVCFFGNSVPVIGVGVLSTVSSPMMAATAFAATIAIFTVAALVAGATESSRA
jgi:MFS family permease